jgi:hypothetical protein
VIFFSGSSSSAKFFWYFSQLDPVALGILRAYKEGGKFSQRQTEDRANVHLDGDSRRCIDLWERGKASLKRGMASVDSN